MKLAERRLDVIKVFTEMTVQGILKISLDNLHIVEILVQMKTQSLWKICR
jgi:hypothetical protein